MPRFRAIINRGKEATERQKERLIEQRTKLIQKYIQWDPIKSRYLFNGGDVNRFCTELKKIEEEREDLKDILNALNRVISFMHSRTNSELKLEKMTQLAEQKYNNHPTNCLCGDCCELAKRAVESKEEEIEHEKDCNYPFWGMF